MKSESRKVGLSRRDALRSIPPDITNLDKVKRQREDIENLYEVLPDSHWDLDKGCEYLRCSAETFLALPIRQVTLFYAPDVREIHNAIMRVADDCSDAVNTEVRKRVRELYPTIPLAEVDVMLRERLLELMAQPDNSDAMSEFAQLEVNPRDEKYRKMVAEAVEREGGNINQIAKRTGHAYQTVQKWHQEFYG